MYQPTLHASVLLVPQCACCCLRVYQIDSVNTKTIEALTSLRSMDIVINNLLQQLGLETTIDEVMGWFPYWCGLTGGRRSAWMDGDQVLAVVRGPAVLCGNTFVLSCAFLVHS
jgi:hypothetical protein